MDRAQEKLKNLSHYCGGRGILRGLGMVLGGAHSQS